MTKKDLKNSAIQLRKQGFTYSEILEKIPVAKSTLSLWLRRVGLTTRQKQRITKKRRQAQFRGAMARKKQRRKSIKRITDLSELEFVEVQI